VYLFFKASRPVLGPNQTHIQLVPEIISVEVNRPWTFTSI